jgi:CBS domain-containing protein
VLGEDASEPQRFSPIRKGTMLKLQDIMTRDVTVVASDMTLRRALELFAQRHITGAPVLEGNKVVGVVSATDLLTFVATVSEETEEAESTTNSTDAWDELSEEDASGLPDVDEEDEAAGRADRCARRTRGAHRGGGDDAGGLQALARRQCYGSRGLHAARQCPPDPGVEGQ